MFNTRAISEDGTDSKTIFIKKSLSTRDYIKFEKSKTMLSSFAPKRQIITLFINNLSKQSFVRNLKHVKAESYIKAELPLDPKELAALNVVPVEKFDKNNYKRGLEEEEKPIPTSPILGPIRVYSSMK